MSKKHILWHRENSKNANFTEAEANLLRPICKSCVYGESRQTGTDHHRVHRPRPTLAGQCFAIDAFACSRPSARGINYCDLQMDLGSHAIYCNFTKSRSAPEIVDALSRTWNLNPTWLVYDSTIPGSSNARFIRMDPESAYKSETVLRFAAERGYKIEHTAPRDKHAGGVAERMVGLVTAKANSAMLAGNAPVSMWDHAFTHTVQTLNFNYSEAIGTSPYNFITGVHIDMNYIHGFFSECFMFIPPKERTKLPARRAHRCKLLSYAYTTILVPIYNVIIINDNNTYGQTRTSKDVIFDESCIYDINNDNSPSDERFELLINKNDNKIILPENNTENINPIQEIIQLYDPLEYKALELGESPIEKFPLIVVDEDFGNAVDEYGFPVYWNKVTGDIEEAEVLHISQVNHSEMMAQYVMQTSPHMPSKFSDAFAQEKWQQPIIKELTNFVTNNCFQWVPDTGQRRLHMKWIFSAKADLSLKARLVARGDRCKPGVDYDPEDVYCGNVTASSIKIFFALAALYGLIMRGGDLVGAYLVTPGSKDYVLCMSTPEGIIAQVGMILQVLGNLYGLPSSGRNFSKAVDAIVKALGYMSTPYDPKFFVKWIEGMPILVMFHSDDFRWCGPPDMIGEWDKLVAAFEASKYKVKDCTKEPFVGINVTTDDQGNYYLDQKKAIEGVAKVAKVTGSKPQRLPYPLEGESLSKKDNAKNPAEIREASKTPYRTLIGMLSYIMGHTKPDIAYALNVLSRYCNNPGPRHIIFLKVLCAYCHHTKDNRLKFTAHHGPYDSVTMKTLTQLRFQCDADLAGNLDNFHSTTAYIGYLGANNVVSFTSKTQGSLSTSTAESEIKAVNQCLKEDAIAMRGMLILMGFPQDPTIIEEDNQACVYASQVPHLTRGMKHLDLAEMLIKEKVENNEIKLLKVASGDNTSDLGTKRLALPLFTKLTYRIIDMQLRVNT